MRQRSGKHKKQTNWDELHCFGCACLQLWPRVVLRKWLNISSRDSDFSADEGETTESEFEYDEICQWERHLLEEERKLGGLGAESYGRPMDDIPHKWRRTNSETLRAQYINNNELRIFAGTWNVGGKLPPDDLEMKGWLGMAEPADIYVLCLQEIVPLNAGNIFGAEDNKPVSRWECLIRRALNKIKPAKLKYKSYSNPSSPSRYQPSDDNLCFEDALLQGSDSETDEEVHQLVEDSHDFDSSYSHSVGSAKLSGNTISSFTNDDSIRSQDSGHLPLSSRKMFKKPHCLSFKNHPLASVASMTEQKRVTRTLSCSDRIGLLWPEQQLDILAELSLDGSNTFKFSENPNYFKSVNQNCRGFAGSSLLPVLKMDDAVKKKKRSSFVRIISKQMVGVYLSIWVRRSLRKHIQNLKISTVGVGAMGYIGNKGSISASMSIYQTLFCFVCCHLTSGEKDGDKLRRNAEVQEIHKRTLFRSTPGIGLPKTIFDHERIIWLGDLNYRMDLSYDATHELISRKDWSKLIEHDQLKKELRKGRAFDGWLEGVINFPPTYKYELSSERYIGGDPKVGRRTPAWCDRILSFGKGIRLVEYRRSELKLSDHRPVTAIFMVDVEILCRRKLQRALTFMHAEIEEEEHLLDEDGDYETSHLEL
ncbi:Type I inositol 1,4,5-trisphosphate 5-phosphatase 1 [Platanthera guangdongensis]|uniref:Type I inositol 1,4,5-trisphosphate 5-phosphatase 1 n=1 Tax=Platanthera guangdongensis TaxID=2320717 RepID=A0ABR2LKG0_9ASPA